MEIENQHFYVKQISTGCLSQYAYYIESQKEAVIIDPLRDIDQYLELIKSRGSTLKFVICTHIHADFVSGFWDLSKKTGAQIILGPKDEITFKHLRGDDGKVFGLGDVDLQIIHTPGHTLESICILLINKLDNNKQEMVFTGDTLFVGDVGRPDLAVKNGEITKRDLSDHLFDSLKKLTLLDDDCKVMPAHGAGSACGKNLGKESFSTIKEQKDSNYAVKIDNKDDFYKALTEDLPTPPDYFFHDVKMNLNNDQILPVEQILKKGRIGLSPDKVEEFLSNPEYIVIDTRDSPLFIASHVPHSISIPLKGSAAIWTASIFDINTKIIIVCDPESVDESILRLSRTGMDHIEGHLEGGIQSWTDAGKPAKSIKILKPTDLTTYLDSNPESIIVDVRNNHEIETGTLKNAKYLHLDNIHKNASNHYTKDIPLLMMCRTGMRATIACSLLERQGYDVRVIEGGFVGAKDHGHEVHCPKLT